MLTCSPYNGKDGEHPTNDFVYQNIGFLALSSNCIKRPMENNFFSSIETNKVDISKIQ